MVGHITINIGEILVQIEPDLVEKGLFKPFIARLKITMAKTKLTPRQFPSRD